MDQFRDLSEKCERYNHKMISKGRTIDLKVALFQRIFQGFYGIRKSIDVLTVIPNGDGDRGLLPLGAYSFFHEGKQMQVLQVALSNLRYHFFTAYSSIVAD